MRWETNDDGQRKLLHATAHWLLTQWDWRRERFRPELHTASAPYVIRGEQLT
jgi:hypothetical protein